MWSLMKSYLAGHFWFVTTWIFLVTAIPAVKVSVTDILPWDPEALSVLIASYWFTFMISVVFLSVVAVGLVTLVRTVKPPVTPVMGRDAVGCIELVFSTRELAGLTVRRSWNWKYFLKNILYFHDSDHLSDKCDKCKIYSASIGHWPITWLSYASLELTQTRPEQDQHNIKYKLGNWSLFSTRWIETMIHIM